MCIETDVIEQINKGPGIYLDPIGLVTISNVYLHILPIDIGYIKPHIANIRNVQGTNRFLCQQNEFNIKKFNNFLQLLTLQLDSITRDYSAISHLISDKIIGTMDENDAIGHDTAITFERQYHNDLLYKITNYSYYKNE